MLHFKSIRQAIGLLGLCAASTLLAHAQGALTVTPGRAAATSVGTGTIGYTGDNGAGASATLASPSAVTYDSSGNLYIADTNNHVIRKQSVSGTITTVAGNGVAGFSGDGGAATSASLDTPTGVAVDANGNIYIADSHNNRIRKVSSGTISTIAGAGTAGFSGDGAAATAATLNRPSAIAVDAGGTIYIADTNNQRIRKISGTNITTIAGNGEQGFTGDGASASAASLDSPTGVAVDASGNVYIADRHNQRIRVVNSAGTISTVAGSGAVSFAGGYAGDSASATAASLARPTGVSIDANGNVYIADTDNQRVRQLSSGIIATAAGSGAQGFAGDGSALAGATLNAPKSVATSATGSLAIADTANQRIRSSSLPSITFAAQSVGVVSNAQPVTLANSGTASISVSSINFTGPFTATAGGTCSATPITLAAGASCTQNVAFLPVAAGSASGSVVFGGTGVVPQTILLTGTAVQAATTSTLTSSAAAPFINQNVTFTATVAPAGAGTPTGTVTFYNGGTSLGAGTLINGVATYTTTFAAAGTYTITAQYAGDSNFVGGASNAIAQLVGDFNFTITPDQSSGGATSKTVKPGEAAIYSFSVAPLNGPFSFPITLSATGLPPGATVTFSPSTVTLGANPASFTMTIQTASNTGALRNLEQITAAPAALAMLLLPFAGRMRRKGQKTNPLLAVVFVFGSLAAVAGLSGCGATTGFFAQPQKQYTINVIGTAQGAGGATLQHVATVNLTIQ